MKCHSPKTGQAIAANIAANIRFHQSHRAIEPLSHRAIKPSSHQAIEPSNSITKWTRRWKEDEKSMRG
jgi:hypothetical protein